MRLECTAPRAYATDFDSDPNNWVRFASIEIDGHRRRISEAISEDVARRFLVVAEYFKRYDGPTERVDAVLAKPGHAALTPRPPRGGNVWRGKRLAAALTVAPARKNKAEVYFSNELKLAELQLERASCNPKAWQLLQPYFSKRAVVAFGSDLKSTSALLGPMSPRQDEAIFDTRRIEALAVIEEKLSTCSECGPHVRGHPAESARQIMIDLASKHHRDVFEVYLAELRKPVDFEALADAERWRAAYRGSVAAAALEKLDDCKVVAATRAFLERLARQERIIARSRAHGEEAKIDGMRQSAEERRERSREGGIQKKGRRLPHVRVVVAAADFRRRQSGSVSPNSVLELLLQREIPDEVLDAAEPDTLSGGREDDRLPVIVDHEDGTIVFHFMKGPSKRISRKTFDNIVAEASREGSISVSRAGYGSRTNERARQDQLGGTISAKRSRPTR